MYSLVLMAAMTASPATPACHGGCLLRALCGCWGSHGCSGCYGCSGCHGCSGCYGCAGCHGCAGASYGCYGCYGGVIGSYCYGCYGGCYGLSMYSTVAPATIQGIPTSAPAKPEVVPPPKPDADKKTGNDQARLIVDVPEGAKLFIDDQPMKTTSGRRVFRTPRLEKDQSYYYIVRVEVERDGAKQSETKRVIVRAGEDVRAAFNDLRTPAEATAQAGR